MNKYARFFFFGRFHSEDLPGVGWGFVLVWRFVWFFAFFFFSAKDQT
jgi:hypothetical protein